MSKSSSCVVTLRRFGVWRTAVAAVAAAALAALAVWAALAAATADAATWILATAIGLGLGAVLLSLVRVEGGVLACRDGRWMFAPDRSPDVPLPGELAVAIALGSFLLLTFAGAGGRHRRWLPVQRRGLECDWHALRCAVYSPPLAAADALAANQTPP